MLPPQAVLIDAPKVKTTRSAARRRSDMASVGLMAGIVRHPTMPCRVFSGRAAASCNAA
jgi:hypothetical protein